MLRWQDFTPEEALALDLSARLDITAPLNEEGERCPWPWGPQQLIGMPIGQYHCKYCGAMVLAGMEHLDYSELDDYEAPPGSDEPVDWGEGLDLDVDSRP